MKKCCVLFVVLLGAVSLPAQTTPSAATPSPVQNAVAPAGGSVDVAATSPAVGRRRVPERVKGPTPHLADGTVDLSGVWNGGGPIGDIAQGMPKGAVIPMTPKAEKIFKSRQSKDDPEANCLPTGVPRIAPYPWRIVQTPTHVFFLFEGNIHSFRQIFVDGRKHPDDPDPTWYGHSIGHYEGDTLVVDTVGYNDKFWFDFAGHPHTEQLHTVERYKRTDLGTLVIETDITDPGAYTKPFTLSFTANLRPKEELMEYICQENQVDAQHLVGFTGIN
jgi:hypothetical protein